MAPENQIKEGISSKQKIIAVALVIFLIVIIYQVVGMFKGDSSTATTIQPVVTPVANNPTTGNVPSNAHGTKVGAHPVATVQPINQLPPQSSSQMREVPVTMEPRIIDIQKQTQQKYLEQINQLQSLKIQREIAETNQAIASAKLATVTAEKSVTDLLTRPTQTVIPGVYSSTALMPPPPITAPVGENGSTLTTTTQISTTEVPYNVVSVSMELGRWSAIIGFQNKLYNVAVGDVVPVDGSVVASINKNGVTLMKDGKRRKISMTSSA